MTTFAVVSGVAGAQLARRIIIILGLANLFGDGFAMGPGGLSSAKKAKKRVFTSVNLPGNRGSWSISGW